MEDESLSPLNRDLLAQILVRIDGPTLAAATCASSDFNGIAKADGLWEALCHSTWPSTREEKARDLISSSFGGFLKFYANSFPLIVYKPLEDPCEIESSNSEEAYSSFSSSPADLISLVDVYYKDKCIFSKVLYGIPGAEEENQNGGWFLDGPFRLDALQYQYGTSGINDDDDDDEEEEDAGMLPSVPLVEKKGKGGGKLCKKLEKNVRLSWVILDTKSGRAANLSSWKPLLVRWHWPSEGDILMHFGCIVPGEGGNPIECAISVKCRLLQREGCLQWRDICMQMENKEGAHIDGKRSLTVLDRAFKESSRSWKCEKFEKGYRAYMKEKREAMEKRMRSEHLAENLFVCTGITLFAAFCHMLISFTQ